MTRKFDVTSLPIVPLLLVELLRSFTSLLKYGLRSSITSLRFASFVGLGFLTELRFASFLWSSYFVPFLLVLGLSLKNPRMLNPWTGEAANKRLAALINSSGVANH